MSRPTYSASNVARYILALADPEDNDISNLKLQKLCFYAQGIISAMRGAPLFHEKVEAWDHGPVVPALYHQYKVNGASAIAVVNNFDQTSIAKEDRQAIQDIFEYYGQFSPWRLRNMTHDEKPWSDAYQRNDREITIPEMVAHFRPIIDDDYVKKVYG